MSTPQPVAGTGTHAGVPPNVQRRILAWYRRHGRTLSFRTTRDPYAILVSEAMAQQTQAARAGEAWTRFMAMYPSVQDLAAATPAAVLRAWQGLGYNRRALSLWRCARQIVDVHGGVVPSELEALQALPGVGPYTARAVAAIAFGRPVGAVDTNVRRVVGRVVAGDEAALDRATLQAVADASVPRSRAAAWTHALMDLGATVCRPRQPDCPRCPVRGACRAAALGIAGVPLPAGSRRDRQPFVLTSRWLRGRIVDQLRAAPDGHWVDIAAPIGGHEAGRVWQALDALAADGLLELHPDVRDGARRARLVMSGG